MTYRRRSNQGDSIIDLALQSNWKTSATLAMFFLIGTLVILPSIFSSKMLFPLVSMLRPIGLLLTLLFATIALIKFVIAPSRYHSEPRLEPGRPDSWTAPANTSSHQNQEVSKLDIAWQDIAKKPETPSYQQNWSLDLLQSIEWKRFEEVVAAYFRHKGYECKTVSFGPDGGVDATIYENDAKVAVVQCKAWNTRLVGVKPVRELLGVMVHQQVGKGYFMITGDYTKEALDFAKAHPITLVAGEGMLTAINRMSSEDQQRLLAIATDGDYMVPTCPSCGIKMLRRTGSKGSFWGCSNYPRCKSKFAIKAEY